MAAVDDGDHLVCTGSEIWTTPRQTGWGCRSSGTAGYGRIIGGGSSGSTGSLWSIVDRRSHVFGETGRSAYSHKSPRNLGLPNTFGDGCRDRALGASAANATIGRSARFIGQNAVQLHGGMGMTEELAIGNYVKRLTAIEYEFGSSDQHIARYAALTKS